MLKERGYYRGPIDGQMGPGTQEAQRRFQEDEARRVQQDNERRQAEAAAKAAEAQAAQAEAQRLETVRQREEAERAAAQRRAGEERLRQIEQDTPWYQRAWRDYGPTAGLVAGFGAGAFTRSYIGKNLEAKARETAERANRLMEAAGRGPVVARISRVNQFWTEGRPGSEAPFVRDPRGSAYPFKINPNAPPAEELYHPSMATRFGPAATVVGGGGVETGFGELLVRGAEEELRNAYAAVQQDPSEANIQRLATARDKLAGYEAIRNAGRGVAVGGIVTEGKSRLTYRHTRPDIATAEAERGAIDRLLLAAKRRKSPIEK
jgi:peptidoglycan hydrolase-like protein with peptidoglycan-binding domain